MNSFTTNGFLCSRTGKARLTLIPWVLSVVCQPVSSAAEAQTRKPLRVLLITGGWYHDLLGSWGEDDMRLWLRFYATDDERAKQSSDWPDLPPPPKEPRPFNRDWRLPKGPHA